LQAVPVEGKEKHRPGRQQESSGRQQQAIGKVPPTGPASGKTPIRRSAISSPLAVNWLLRAMGSK